MKRFYKTVSTSKTEGGYIILLDGRSVKTQAKKELLAPTENLADEIMLEWAAQEEKIIPDSMPLTQILNTKIDRVAVERQAMTDSVMKYLNTDLVCYYAEEPPELKEAQDKAWGPVRDWFEKKFDCELQTTNTLVALTQNEFIHAQVLDHVKTMKDDRFVVFQLITSISGSIILALMFVNQEINAEDIFNACRVEEQYQAQIYNEEKYGKDPSQAKRDEFMARDLEASEKYLKALEHTPV